MFFWATDNAQQKNSGCLLQWCTQISYRGRRFWNCKIVVFWFVFLKSRQSLFFFSNRESGERLITTEVMAVVYNSSPPLLISDNYSLQMSSQPVFGHTSLKSHQYLHSSLPCSFHESWSSCCVIWARIYHVVKDFVIFNLFKHGQGRS